MPGYLLGTTVVVMWVWCLWTMATTSIIDNWQCLCFGFWCECVTPLDISHWHQSASVFHCMSNEGLGSEGRKENKKLMIKASTWSSVCLKSDLAVAVCFHPIEVCWVHSCGSWVTDTPPHVRVRGKGWRRTRAVGGQWQERRLQSNKNTGSSLSSVAHRLLDLGQVKVTSLGLSFLIWKLGQ